MSVLSDKISALAEHVVRNNASMTVLELVADLETWACHVDAAAEIGARAEIDASGRVRYVKYDQSKTVYPDGGNV